jgi:hypothetical protein
MNETIDGVGTFMLARLERFAALAADPAPQDPPARRRLARRAALATFSDCVRLGLRDEAVLILRNARASLYGL